MLQLVKRLAQIEAERINMETFSKSSPCEICPQISTKAEVVEFDGRCRVDEARSVVIL